MIDDLCIRTLLEPDLLGYKALRDAMLSSHPEAFTSDAESEAMRPGRGQQARPEVGRQVGAVAGRGQQPGVLGNRVQPGQHARQRAGELQAGWVGQHAAAEGGIGVEVAVGADEHAGRLPREPLDHVRGQRAAVQRHQALVHAAHPAAAAAGEHEGVGQRHPPM